jgi:hypothetical protein
MGGDKMKALHVICRRHTGGKGGRVGVKSVDMENSIWTSEAWVKKLWTAETIIGAMLYLHQSQASPSAFGGEVIECELLPPGEDQPNDRYRLKFKATRDAMGVGWRGNTGMTEQGGLVEVEM